MNSVKKEELDYEFELPWPPTVNHYHQPINTRQGIRVIKSMKVRNYHSQVVLGIRELGLNREGINRPVLISIIMHPPTKKRYDVSNFLKAYEDGLVYSGFLDDDHWIEYDGIRKGDVVKGGKLAVKVKVISS